MVNWRYVFRWALFIAGGAWIGIAVSMALGADVPRIAAVTASLAAACFVIDQARGIE